MIKIPWSRKVAKCAVPEKRITGAETMLGTFGLSLVVGVMAVSVYMGLTQVKLLPGTNREAEERR